MENTQISTQGRLFALMLTYGCNLNCVYCFEKYKDPTKIMSIETARNIIIKEFNHFNHSNNIGKLKIDFFGGEPLLNFDVIKNTTEWILAERKNQNPDFCIKFELSVTTNGTLLDSAKREWFKLHKEYISLILSVDGKPDMQIQNRGCKSEKLPIDFVHETWPDQMLKMTVSRETLPYFAEGAIFFHSKKYAISGSLAVGVRWQKGDELIYKKQLQTLAEYYLSHINIKPIPLFTKIFAELTDSRIRELPYKNCGTGTTMVAYDTDGTPYPCHMFVPLVTGRSNYEDINKIDFNNYESLIEEDCKMCKLLKICRTCYGFNYNQRKNVKHRDKSTCKMILAEAQIISAFQIEYYLKKKQVYGILSNEDLTSLKAAIKCYEMFENYKLPILS